LLTKNRRSFFTEFVENASNSKSSGCNVATTNQQPKPNAEPKTAASAKSYGRISSRADFSSSTNLKIKN